MATAARRLMPCHWHDRAGLGPLARSGDGPRLQSVAGVLGSSVAPGGAAVPVLGDRVLLAAGLAPDRCLRVDSPDSMALRAPGRLRVAALGRTALRRRQAVLVVGLERGPPDVRRFTLLGARKGMLTEEQRAGLFGSSGEISALDRRA